MLVDVNLVCSHVLSMNQNDLWERFAKLSFIVLSATVLLFGGAVVIEPSLIITMAVAATIFLLAQFSLTALPEIQPSFTPTFVHFSRNQIKHLNDPLLI